MEIGKMKVSEVLPYLEIIAKELGLRLNRYNEFKMAKTIMINRYLNLTE